VDSVEVLQWGKETSLGVATWTSLTRVVDEQKKPDYPQTQQQTSQHGANQPQIAVGRRPIGCSQNTHYTVSQKTPDFNATQRAQTLANLKNNVQCSAFSAAALTL